MIETYLRTLYVTVLVVVVDWDMVSHSFLFSLLVVQSVLTFLLVIICKLSKYTWCIEQFSPCYLFCFLFWLWIVCLQTNMKTDDHTLLL